MATSKKQKPYVSKFLTDAQLGLLRTVIDLSIDDHWPALATEKGALDAMAELRRLFGQAKVAIVHIPHDAID